MRDPTESGLLIGLLLPFLLNSNQKFKVRAVPTWWYKCAISQEVTLLCKFLLQKNEEHMLLSICSLVATVENVGGFYRCSVLALNTQYRLLSFSVSGWPSGLRRCVQVAVYSCRRGFESHF